VKRNPLVFVFLFFFFLAAAGFFSYSYFLPRYIEKHVIPDLGGLLSSSVTGKVYRIGFSNAVLGDIVVGDSQNVAGRIGSIHAVYTPSSLLAKKLDNITVNGLTLNLVLSDDKILVPGIDLEKFARTKMDQKGQPPNSGIKLPFGLESFQVINGLINIHYRKQLIPVPFALEISREEKGDPDGLPAYLLNMQIIPPGSESTLTGTLDLGSNTGNIAIAADSLDLNCFGVLFREIQKTMQFGPASLSGKAKFKIMPFQLESAEIDGELASFYLRNVPVTFGISRENAENIVPLHLKLKSQGKHWDVAVQGAIMEPLAGIIDLNGSLVQNNESLRASGKILFRLVDPPPSRNSEHQYLIIKGNPELTGNFFIDLTSSGIWQAKLESDSIEKKDSKAEPFRIQYGGNILETNTPAIAIHGKGFAESHEVRAELDLSDIHALLENNTEIKTPKAKVEVSVSQKRESEQESLTSGSFAVSLPDTQFNNNGLTGKGEIILEGTIPSQVIVNMRPLRAAGKISIGNGALEEQASSLKIGPLDGQIPWHWPLSGQETTGKIKAAQISWENNEVGSFSADIRLRDAVYIIDGRYASSLVKGIVTDVSGKAAIADSGVHASLSLHTAPTPFSSLHLGRIDPALNNSYLAGKLGLDGSFRLDAKGLQGALSVNLQNGRFENPEKKYEVDGIAFALQLPFLPDLRSPPAQSILFEKASFGNLIFEKGKILWQLESGNTLFIEEGVVRWSGGRVFTNAVRISPDMKQFIVTIFCDRLILADILRQFGITNAEGEGTVSGRIPLQVDKGTIRFEDGFLYSSPGQGGSVKVAAFDLLSAGIPKNTPQFAQVDFAAEALRNFTYNWVKLLLNSEGDDLIMQMQMDGKPLQSLPFTYDTQTGLLQRLEDSSKGIDQPIRLDVNFRLPLNRFLGYSGKFKDIMEKIQ